MESLGSNRPNDFTSGKTGSLKGAALRSAALPAAAIFSLLPVLALCAGCSVRFETRRGNSWTMGISRQTVELQPLDHETALAKKKSLVAPFEVAIFPIGIEAAFGWQEQARGFVLPNSITNRFLPPSGVGFGNVNGWFFGVVHYCIPRDNNRVRLLVNTLKGGALRITGADPYVKIGVSKTTLTIILKEPASGAVEYKFSPSGPDFNYSAQSPAPP